jgi:hypothetical protein
MVDEISEKNRGAFDGIVLIGLGLSAPGFRGAKVHRRF